MNRRTALKTLTLGAAALSAPTSLVADFGKGFLSWERVFLKKFHEHKKNIIIWPEEYISPFFDRLERNEFADFIDMGEYQEGLRIFMDSIYLNKGTFLFLEANLKRQERATVFIATQKGQPYKMEIFQIEKLFDSSFKVYDDDHWVESSRLDGTWWDTYSNPKQKFKGFIL